MDGPQEYEVESVTRARVHDKKGKKISWRYYVKWKGYEWDDSTWEPTDSFQNGSEHFLESFWERIDTGGRDISDATAFKKGEELFVSGPPVKRNLKRKASSTKARVAPASEGAPTSNGVAISAPPLSARKRRRVEDSTDDDRAHLKRRSSAGDLKTSTRSSKRGRASSPGPRKSRKPAPKRQPSLGDSQLDADGETDPDVVEVEDELMQVSVEDVEEEAAGKRQRVTASGSAKDSKKIIFEDLEHFYTGHPIEIDQSTDAQKPTSGASPPPVVIESSDDEVPETKASSPPPSEPDPLFDSLPPSSSKTPGVQEKTPNLPHHRARVANPRVKLMDTTTLENASKQARITTKARLISIHAADASSADVPSSSTAKRGGKPRPRRASSDLNIKNRSSLLTVTKGALKSIKGKYARTTTERDEADEIEEFPAVQGTSEGSKHHDNDTIEEGDHTMSDSQTGAPPSGEELLKLAGLQADPELLPDYEDDSSAEPYKAKEPQASNLPSILAEEEPLDQSIVEVVERCKPSDHVAEPHEAEEPQASTLPPAVAEEELPNQSSVEVVEGCKPSDQVIESSTSAPQAAQQTSPSVIDNAPAPSVAAPSADEVKKKIELAKEHLFPSASTSFSSFNSAQSSFRSTIFGPLYQGSTANHPPAAENEFSTTFRVILGDGVELPMLLKDCSELKTRISDILIGNSSGSKVALFYSADDALAMINTFKSDGTARVVLDPSATTTQQERYSIFRQRFEASQTLVAPVGKEVCVVYSSENAGIVERLGTPAHLRGLSDTLLVSHASIENQLGYVAAIMKATAV